MSSGGASGDGDGRGGDAGLEDGADLVPPRVSFEVLLTGMLSLIKPSCGGGRGPTRVLADD